MTLVYLGLGSNLGDRAENLRRATKAIHTLADTSVLRLSHVYESEPIGVADQPRFLNAVAEVETSMGPRDFLGALKRIEYDLGRSPSAERWGPRVIDIDIVLWGSAQIDVPGLRVPHPEFRKRAFVLAPLCELAPDAVDPETGRTIRELSQRPGLEGATRDAGPLDTITEPLR